MNYELLETFTILCATENLTQTARLLYKTQPAVSHRIKLLEEELGFTLIHRERGKKTVSITPRGKAFLEIAGELMAIYEKMDAETKELSNTIQISSIASIRSPIVTDICKEMIRDHNTRISILTHQTPEAYDMIASRTFDIAFVSYAEKRNSILCEPVFRQDYIVAKYCEHPGETREILTGDLDPGCEVYQFWNEEFRLWHHSKFGNNNYIVRVDTCSALEDFMTVPGRWTILQESNLEHLKRKLPIQAYRLLDGPPPRTCYMITSSVPDPSNRKTISLFCEKVRDYAKVHNIST